MCSNNLQQTQVNEIGREFAGSTLEPYLKISEMLARFQSSGSSLSSRLCLKICRTGANSVAAALRATSGIPSGSTALSVFRVHRSVSTLGGTHLKRGCGDVRPSRPLFTPPCRSQDRQLRLKFVHKTLIWKINVQFCLQNQQFSKYRAICSSRSYILGPDFRQKS